MRVGYLADFELARVKGDAKQLRVQIVATANGIATALQIGQLVKSDDVDEAGDIQRFLPHLKGDGNALDKLIGFLPTLATVLGMKGASVSIASMTQAVSDNLQ